MNMVEWLFEICKDMLLDYWDRYINYYVLPSWQDGQFSAATEESPQSRKRPLSFDLAMPPPVLPGKRQAI